MEPLKYMSKGDIMFNRFIILFANFLLNAFGIEVKLLCICLHSSRSRDAKASVDFFDPHC